MNIGDVLTLWKLDNPRIGDRYHKDSERLIYKIETSSGNFLLKGFPGEKPETTIHGNVNAHLFLGNENEMAPKLYQTKDGQYYIKEQDYWFYLMEFIDGRQMEEISREEYDLVFQGAIQMHISYMQSYGSYAVDSLWKILRYGIDQKEILWEMVQKQRHY